MVLSSRVFNFNYQCCCFIAFHYTVFCDLFLDKYNDIATSKRLSVGDYIVKVVALSFSTLDMLSHFSLDLV